MPSAFHWCALCSSTCSYFQSVVSPVFEIKSLSLCSGSPSSPFSTLTSTQQLCSRSHSHCRSMSVHLSGRLDHSPPRTGYDTNRVPMIPMEDVVDLTEGDSDDDLPDVNHDAHAIALTLSPANTTSTTYARFPSSCRWKLFVDTPNQHPKRGGPPVYGTSCSSRPSLLYRAGTSSIAASTRTGRRYSSTIRGSSSTTTASCC